MAGRYLFAPLEPSDERNVIETVFGPMSDHKQAAYQEYIDYYRAELQNFNFAVVAAGLRDTSWNSFPIQNHADLRLVIESVKQHGPSTRPQVRQVVKEHFRSRDASIESWNRCIDLAIRILLMLNVREPQYALQTPQTPVVQWNDEATLLSFVTKQFACSTKFISGRDRRVHPLFTVANMASICGLRVEWTQSLEDHLRLDRRAKVLRIFPYKKCLLSFLDCAARNGERSILPKALLEETVDTLDLLFPFWDKKTVKFLHRRQQFFHEYGPYIKARSLDLNEFEYWRDRLLELHEEIFLSPPDDWIQLWLDRRNPQQWLTLWIALIVFLLTLISTASSIIQAWASVKALNS